MGKNIAMDATAEISSAGVVRKKAWTSAVMKGPDQSSFCKVEVECQSIGVGLAISISVHA